MIFYNVPVLMIHMFVSTSFGTSHLIAISKSLISTTAQNVEISVKYGKVTAVTQF